MRKQLMLIGETKIVSGGDCCCYQGGKVIASANLLDYLACQGFCCEGKKADSYSTSFPDHYFCHSHSMKV